MELNKRPGVIRCSDCRLDLARQEIDQIVGRLTAAIVVATAVLVVFEIVFGLLASTLAADITGVLIAYVAGALVLAFPLGPLYAPYLVVEKLTRLEDLRADEARVLATRDGARGEEPEPEAPPDAEPVPAGHPRPSPPPHPRPSPKVSPRHRRGHRRSSPWGT